jgi:hypothetical protein
MNDVNEAYKHISHNCRCDVEVGEVLMELKRYRQISLTMDSSTYQGYDISAMWGHYAEKGKGVCLVFDRHKLLSCLNDNMYSCEVNYKKKYKGNVRISSNNIGRCLERRRKEFLFTKSIDWKYEQEYRIITKVDDCSNELFLELKDSLIAVILQYADDSSYNLVNDSVFSSLHFKILERINKQNLIILECGHFFEDSNLRNNEGICFSDDKTVELA